MGMDYQLPIVMMIGLQGLEKGRAPSDSDQNGVRIVEPILKTMDIQYQILNGTEDVEGVPVAIEEAYVASQPRAILIPRVGEQ
jgi:sulfopyruvate decarboxylase TPP-binding subunit